jgi:hypothetical protein
MPEIKVPLTRPLTTHDGVLNEITLREPHARDFIAMKRLPFSIVFHQSVRPGEMGQPDATTTTERQGELTTDYDLAFQWISRLSKIDTLILGTLGLRDTTRLVNALRAMIGEADADQDDKVKVEEQVKN